MTDLTHWLPADDLALITPDEQRWLAGIFERFGGYPSLEELWAVMDEPWRELNCDPEVNRPGYSGDLFFLRGYFHDEYKTLFARGA